MLSYYEQYNISGGIYTAFQRPTKKNLKIKHPYEKIEKMKPLFPYKDYEGFTRANFIITVLYIMFTKSPSSLMSLYDFLRQDFTKEVYKFKGEIISYNKYIKEDIFYLKNLKEEITPDFLFEEYRSNNIKWFTVYFYTVLGKKEDEVNKSRINKKLLKNFKSLMLYLSFKEESIIQIRKLFEEQITF